MAKIYVFLADGCEEIEALTPVDILPDFATCSILTIEKNVENTAFGLYFFNFMI